MEAASAQPMRSASTTGRASTTGACVMPATWAMALSPAFQERWPTILRRRNVVRRATASPLVMNTTGVASADLASLATATPTASLTAASAMLRHNACLSPTSASVRQDLPATVFAYVVQSPVKVGCVDLTTPTFASFPSL